MQHLYLFLRKEFLLKFGGARADNFGMSEKNKEHNRRAIRKIDRDYKIFRIKVAFRWLRV